MEKYNCSERWNDCSDSEFGFWISNCI